MIAYGPGLLGGHARKPLDELVQRGVVLQVLEERGDRHAGTREHPGAAHAVRMTIDFRTGWPIANGQMLALDDSCGTSPTPTTNLNRRRSRRERFYLPLPAD